MNVQVGDGTAATAFGNNNNVMDKDFVYIICSSIFLLSMGPMLLCAGHRGA